MPMQLQPQRTLEYQSVPPDGRFSTYKNPQADSLILTGRSEVSTERRAEVYRKLLDVLKVDPGFIPLFREWRFHGLSEGTVWMPRPDGQILGRDILEIKQ
jgi:ABC-type transport system substrate-binding protein